MCDRQNDSLRCRKFQPSTIQRLRRNPLFRTRGQQQHVYALVIERIGSCALLYWTTSWIIWMECSDRRRQLTVSGVASDSHNRWICALILVVTVCTTACLHNSNDLVEELKVRESNEGLAVVCMDGHWFQVISFASNAYPVPLHLRKNSSAWIAQDGYLVAWNVHTVPSGPCEGTTTVNTMDGEVLTQIPGSIVNPRTMAVSADGRRIAFDGTYMTSSIKPLEGSVGVRYLDVQSGNVVNVSSDSTSRGSGTLSWSPAGDALTYGNGSQIYILDVSSGLSRSIARGYDPTWSPDAQWISFRSLDGSAIAINPVTLAEKKLLPYKILGAVHWSPDAKYVFVTEAVGSIQTILHLQSLPSREFRRLST